MMYNNDLGKKFFKDHQCLIRNLQRKSKKYHLIKKLYLPIIKTYAAKYPIEDWLCIPFFEFLYRQDSESKKRLKAIEKELRQIRRNTGKEKFDELCSNIIVYVKHSTCNGVHNKLFDFNAELMAMHVFARKGYDVEKIKESNKESRADLQVTKQGKSSFVECKFIHASNPFETYIRT